MRRMDPQQHWAAWCERYGDDYDTDEARQAAYRDFTATLAEMRDVFSQSDDAYNAGHRAAQQHAAAGNASPGDAESLVPPDLNTLARADWLEGFRSHFAPRPARH